MTLISKKDLKYDGYKWTPCKEKDPKVKTNPDQTVLNRQEGYEILYLINKIAELNNFKDIEEGLKIERMIHQQLPEDVLSHEETRKWIEENWD